MSGKACFKCREFKAHEEFYKHPGMADGRLGKCKACAKADSAKHREENIDRVREYDRERGRSPGRKALSVEMTRRWRKQDRRRVKCHNAVARAIRSGKLVREPCERCSSPEALAHHESYERPLDVSWLCQPCHKQRHKEMVLEGIEP